MRVNEAINQFKLNIKGVRDLYGIHTAFKVAVPSVDPTEVLRAVIVMAVSALDCYLHDLIVLGTVDIYTNSFKYGFTNKTLRPSNDIGWLQHKLTLNKLDQLLEIENSIREVIETKTFQDPDIIAKNLQCLGVDDLWNRVAGDSRMTLSEPDIKKSLKLIVNRRNDIVHEADIDRSKGTVGIKKAISDSDVYDDILFIELLGEVIHDIFI